MTASTRTLYIEQGATFHLGFNWHKQALNADGSPKLDVNGNPVPGEPYDLVGCTARMQIRRRRGDVAILTATSLGTGEGARRIHLKDASALRQPTDLPSGRVDITLTDQDTDLLNVRSAVYDLEIEWPIQPDELRPRVDRLLQGTVEVSLNITEIDT